ncbi:IclR family transcriptional regulator [Lysinibacillus endophyticus]|uniref:IclR family transcriptional regulator n=1 Tax=Ureibacillus endophyticus TaxID=1978490 RepID=UPI0031374836
MVRDVNIAPIRSVGRAIDIIEAFVNVGDHLSIEKIMEETKLPKATVYRLLYTLELRGLIQYDEQKQTYSLGLKFLTYGHIIDKGNEILNVAKPILEDLQQKVNQTVMMAVPDGEKMVYVYSKENEHGLKFSTEKGRRRPITYGVVGKVFMSYMDQQRIEQLLGVKKYEQFQPARARILADGYYIEYEETNPGVNGIGTGIIDRNDNCLAVIAVVGPSILFNEDQLHKGVQQLLLARNEIALKLNVILN